jgi:multicomponent Na+:H+ antiporter subunit G
METLLHVIGGTFLIVGAVFALIGAIGVLRLPDFFTRLHAGGITDTMGAGSILIGLMFYAGPSLVTFKLATILFFLLITSPTSAHALSKSALTHGVEPELADDREPR